MHRNLSIHKYFQHAAANHTPKFRFSGSTEKDWRQWREAALPAVQATCAAMPRKVPLNPEILAEWREDGLIKQRVIFDVEDGLSAVAYLFRPENASGKLPAILCCHGHGPYGKDAIMGIIHDPDVRANINAHNYDYGVQMAKAGFVTIAIDWRGFGERDDRRKPNNTAMPPGRDPCNLFYLRATLLGMTMLGMNVNDGRCALDYLCQQSFVDSQKIGVMGLSFGGTMTTWMSLMDERIKAADIICYSDRFADFAFRDFNCCGSQVNPGLYALADLPDLHGLIAPRPLLVEIGLFDQCFLMDSSLSCFKEVEKIYSAAGLRDRLELDLFEGGHQWGGHKSAEFFRKHLTAR